jgi:hypothetical protein
MTRIYLDTNVFSNLQKGQTDAFAEILRLIKLYKPNLSFFFSPAHIRDKRKDLTEHKFKDFDFMETLTDDNYISYHALDKKDMFYLATPRMVFDDHADGGELSELADFWQNKDSDDALIKDLKRTIKERTNAKPLDIPPRSFETTDENQQALLNKLFPSGQNPTLWNMIETFASFSVDMYANHQTYKDIRSLIDKNYNAGKITLEGDFDFNKAFKDSAFKKSFLAFVNDTMHKPADGKIEYYSFYQHCYLCLDIFGINKDKISKKNAFNNLLNDALHSYYAGYLDYFVTDDESNLEKSNALYSLFDIKTIILTSDQFLEILPSIGENTEEDISEFMNHLKEDIEKGFPRHGNIEEQHPGIPAFSPGRTYLNFFDQILQIRSENGVSYFLRKNLLYSLAGPNYREKAMLIDRCILIFGMDLEQKGLFDLEKEPKEINKETWSGRVWQSGDLFLHVHFNNVLHELVLSISENK